MATGVRKFGFRIDGSSAAAVAHVTLVIDDGDVDLTPSLTQQEVDTYIAMLKADLDAAGKRAKAALDRARMSS